MNLMMFILKKTKPTIFINEPDNNQTITSKQISVKVNAFAKRGINRVEYYIDGQLIGSSTNYPYLLNTSLSSYFKKGYHKLRAVAFDDVDNNNEASIDINILVDFLGQQEYGKHQIISLNTASLIFQYNLQLSWVIWLAYKKGKFLAEI